MKLVMHQSERVTSTSGSLEELLGEESDPESWPGDSTSPTDSELGLEQQTEIETSDLFSDFYSDSDFDDAEGPEVLTGPQSRGGLPQQNGTPRQSSFPGFKCDGWGCGGI